MFQTNCTTHIFMYVIKNDQVLNGFKCKMEEKNYVTYYRAFICAINTNAFVGVFINNRKKVKR